MCAAHIRWGSGCVAQVVASRVAAGRRREIRVWGRDAYLHVDLDAGQAAVARGLAGADWEGHVRALQGRSVSLAEERLTGAGEAAEEALSTQALVLGDGEPLRAEVEALVAAVRGAPSRGVGGPEGLRALRLAERILADAGRRDAGTGA